MLPIHTASTVRLQAHASRHTHYERIGGREAIVRLVEAFYLAMETEPAAAAIRAMHERDLTHTKAVLVTYLCEWMGGAKGYTAERGPPRLRMRHQPFAIDDAARDAWMACMRSALAQVCPDADLKRELEAAFFKVADFLRNQPSPPSPPTKAER
ncbi:group II truncated hemoglobin [Ideonella sp. DXS29W]|uniref:Group II truncated hemoglobin n=1 Tax=Ideonella lacteola TaxID=2984193 RepID=A0ABU9BTS0_9BURK